MRVYLHLRYDLLYVLHPQTGQRCEIYGGKHSALYTHEGTKQ